MTANGMLQVVLYFIALLPRQFPWGATWPESIRGKLFS